MDGFTAAMRQVDSRGRARSRAGRAAASVGGAGVGILVGAGRPGPQHAKGQVGDLAFDAVVPVKGTAAGFPLNPYQARADSISNGFNALRALQRSP